MFAPGKGFLEMGAGGGDGESLIRLSELKFQAVSFDKSGCREALSRRIFPLLCASFPHSAPL